MGRTNYTADRVADAGDGVAQYTCDGLGCAGDASVAVVVHGGVCKMMTMMIYMGSWS